MDINQLLKETVEKNASDLHLSTGQPPMLRLDGTLQTLESPALDQDTLITMLHSVMDEKQRASYKDDWEIDFSYTLGNDARFRVNAYTQERGAGATFRTIPTIIPTLEELKLPSSLQELCKLRNGMVLVTGPTGSGKSTTLAAMIDYINANFKKHIITIEDPIEFVHPCKQSLISQRQVDQHTKDFNIALRSALREDPDIILVGEMRDPETIQLALSAAETGHLVFGTLHTTSAPKAIDRIIDVFPAGDKEMIRTMVSESLRAVISQMLVKRTDQGRIAALEIMTCTPAIRNLIRENKIPQIYSALQTGQTQGMCTMEQYLQKLVGQGVVSDSALDQSIMSLQTG